MANSVDDNVYRLTEPKIKQQTAQDNKAETICEDHIGKTFSVVVDPDGVLTLSVVPNKDSLTYQPHLVDLSTITKSSSYHKVTKTIFDKLSVQDLVKVGQDYPHGFIFKIGEFEGITGNSVNLPYSIALMSRLKSLPCKPNIVSTGKLDGDSVKCIGSLRRKLKAVYNYNKTNGKDLIFIIPNANLSEYQSIIAKNPKLSQVKVKSVETLEEVLSMSLNGINF